MEPLKYRIINLNQIYYPRIQNKVALKVKKQIQHNIVKQVWNHYWLQVNRQIWWEAERIISMYK